ncbi:oxidoreductase [Pimelobacter sp. 30-1]|uniref:oxidoreductase n=1 Tax=Pimelobacter sp. 30-1 TaxID=2004991 RepID=UPI001C046684|nr:oxidoreductase [Pimelobacter sp. 30-1]MBU2693830.1 short-chain dehydrogenase/reductase [Pimelobacter sp. 30-1]
MSAKPTRQVVIVTGASSGIGESTARRLAEDGHIVFGAARRLDKLEKLRQHGIEPLTMDVTDENSMVAGIQTIIDTHGRLDVLVNNAGYGSYGALEDVPLEEARRQFEVNVFGAARLMQLALPHMRQQGSGTIINITSMGGKIYTPLGSWYHATKFALEALSDCARLEAAPFGVDVAIIEPGGIRTEWGGIAADLLRETSGHTAYADQANAVAESLAGEGNARFSSDPSVIANAISKAVAAKRPKTRYAVGFGAKPLIALHDKLPDRAFDRLIRRASGIK